jgi:hypothetical protein
MKGGQFEPIVKPWDVDRTLWNVCSVGRDIKADWFVIHRCLTESNVLAKMIRFL